jgi:hypothetical protein
VVNLVYWSFVVALTPITLDLAWKLVSTLPHGTNLGLSGGFEDADPWGSTHSLKLDSRSGCITMARRPSRPGSRG